MKSSMDQLNEKRAKLKDAEQSLSAVIAQKEDKLKAIADKLEVLKARENELNSKSSHFTQFALCLSGVISKT